MLSILAPAPSASVTSSTTSLNQQQLSQQTPLSDNQGNVLKKVASFTTDGRSNDNGSAKILRPSFVPEKLNFATYEKFEGMWNRRNRIIFFNNLKLLKVKRHEKTNILFKTIIGCLFIE